MNELSRIRIARLRPDARIPTRKHRSDAGLDLFAVEAVILPPHSVAIIPTGITVDIPEGVVGLIKPKGRSDHLLGAGVVDAGYQGEILVKVVNPFAVPLEFKPGDPLGQLLLLPVMTPVVEEVGLEEIHPQVSPRSGTGGIVEQRGGTFPGEDHPETPEGRVGG
jgi:dUTP pyrophosphatase